MMKTKTQARADRAAEHRRKTPPTGNKVVSTPKKVNTGRKPGDLSLYGKVVLLSEVADLLMEAFPGAQIAKVTPYDWWKKHKLGRLSVALPLPARMIGNGPLFMATDIIKWYRVFIEINPRRSR